MDIFFIAVIILVLFAVFDLIVGVSNDAVNFLNSSFGSKVAPFKVILFTASLGIVAGVTFSSGMMEVARKSIFNPAYFTMPELLIIFLAVMITDIILLDLFNTYALPTSTTVSIVFELLGAALAVSVLKIIKDNGDLVLVGKYINTAKAMVIIFSILLSVGVAFVFGVITQFVTRLIFTFDYKKRIRRYGALWGGAGLASICYFIVIKGAKGASFITDDMLGWINTHTTFLLLSVGILSAVVLQMMISLRVNILKPIILIGTFALAMAFAANDLVNFIGVPLAGYHSYKVALLSADPLHITMTALNKKVPSATFLLLLAGLVMVATLWFSKKARSVTETEVGLGKQEEGVDKFGSTFLSRTIVRMWINIYGTLKVFVPVKIRTIVSHRLNPDFFELDENEETPSFDLIRASVNLIVASALISYATSKKLPLSTTYVTFMVAMGTSFADGAWGRETAVYRITGVLTVIGGWFLTALMASTVSGIFAVLIFYIHWVGILLLIILTFIFVYQTHKKFKEKIQASPDSKIFNLKKVRDAETTVSITFEHTSFILQEIREAITHTLNYLFKQNLKGLRKQKKKTKKIQSFTNIVVANIFKALRLLQKKGVITSYKYAQTIHRLQEIADASRDIIMRSYDHINNQHEGLTDEQVDDLVKVKDLLSEILTNVEYVFNKKQPIDYELITKKDNELKELAETLNQSQLYRILDRTSKTRLTILFYAIVEDAITLSHQSLKLMDIFRETFGDISS